MVIVGLILNFLGSVLLIIATPWVKHEKEYGALSISETKKKLFFGGLILLATGFFIQLIERIAPLFIK